MKEKNVLQIDSLVIDYSNKHFGLFRRNHTRAVNGISFSLHKGEILGVLGESGSGKSSLLKAICRFIPIQKGRIFIDEIDVTSFSNKKFFPYRKKIQLIPQDFCDIFNPKMTVKRILTEPLDVHFPYLTSRKKETRIIELLESVELDRSLLERFPSQLSGGQRQRLSIARGLAVEPELLMCDEIISASDLYTQKQILLLLQNLNRKKNIAILFVSHNIAVVSHLCHNIIVMRKGKVLDSGTPYEICKTPKSLYVQLLLDSVPKIKAI
ncbi:MAG: dipeptide/oligopeptide/nickel ABC transporter ATP-binding protein [Puniceicoccales bacterium]|jgi:ABC-type oligopeptide transport system ATPase subunit|nr:dipeptide/oligopeptide/nickel ABC transporter ATP-binding protein [Puniceicoccales bacterium]